MRVIISNSVFLYMYNELSIGLPVGSHRIVLLESIQVYALVDCCVE